LLVFFGFLPQGRQKIGRNTLPIDPLASQSNPVALILPPFSSLSQRAVDQSIRVDRLASFFPGRSWQFLLFGAGGQKMCVSFSPFPPPPFFLWQVGLPAPDRSETAPPCRQSELILAPFLSETKAKASPPPSHRRCPCDTFPSGHMWLNLPPARET